MISDFEQLLNEAIEDGTDPDQIQSALNLVQTIRTAEAQIMTMKEQLSGMGEELCAAAARELRKLLPRMEAKLNRSGCTFTYKSRSISIAPNFEEGAWTVQPGPSKNDKGLLSKVNPADLNVSLDKYKELVRVIGQIFAGRYKTLQGGKVEPYAPPPDADEVPDEAIDQALNATDPQATPEPDANPPAVDSPTPGVPPYA